MKLYAKHRKYFLAILPAVLIVIAVGIYFLGDDGEGDPASSPSPQSIQGFTFFDLGAGTRLSDAIRKRLEGRLGAGVQETNSIIDLSINYSGFLKTHFPELHRLNLMLNDSGGARVEHDVIKLTYRYALRKNTPFYYVELVFSNVSRQPLYFFIKSKKEGGSVIETFRTKYGEAEKIDWAGEKGSALFWKKIRDVLVVSKLMDRLGLPEYHVSMYFVENINRLIALEEKIKKRAVKSKAEAGKTAF